MTNNRKSPSPDDVHQTLPPTVKAGGQERKRWIPAYAGMTKGNLPKKVLTPLICSDTCCGPLFECVHFVAYFLGHTTIGIFADNMPADVKRLRPFSLRYEQ